MMINTRIHSHVSQPGIPRNKTNIITVWSASRRDWNAVRHIEAACFGWMRNVFGLWPRVGQSDTHTWVAGMNAAPVGYLIAYPNMLDEQPVMYIGGVGTLPEYRRRGVGTHLMHAVLSEYPRLWLHVRAGNADAIALYQNLGLQQVRRLPRFYSNGDDAIVMATS